MHIPFCEKRCGYCAFNTFSDKTALIDDYVKALIIQLSKELSGIQNKLQSVYFGGGTPSLLGVSHFKSLFDVFYPNLDKGAEITIEANPSSFSLDKAKALIDMGANRISLGMQSLDDKKLKFLSRVHDKKKGLTAYETARKAGFQNVSIDLIYDTPLDDARFLTKELDDFISLKPEHISAYSLTIEENTPFAKAGITQKEESLSKLTANLLVRAGYEHYETSSFAKIRSRHNLGYWERKKYVGAGAGAVGFNGRGRLYPHRKIEEYIKEPLVASVEEIGDYEERLERLLLGLRSVVGVDIVLLKGKECLIRDLLDANLIFLQNSRVYATDFFLADEIALKLS